jgi:hypothetical protein
VASACYRNLSSPHVESILPILTCLFRPIYHTSLVLISPVVVLLIGADSHQRDTVPVPPLLHIIFRFTPFTAPLLFPCPPLCQRSSAFCSTHISCSTYATYSICGCHYAGKVVISFPAIASGLFILCLAYPLSARSADPRLLSNAGSVPRLSNLAAPPLRSS